MKKKENPEDWLRRACASIGYTPEQFRGLWIRVRSGDNQAKLELYKLMTANPGLAPLIDQMKYETRMFRKSVGKQTQKGFGSLNAGKPGVWSTMQSKRVNGVTAIHQGGLPSLGKRSR